MAHLYVPFASLLLPFKKLYVFALNPTTFFMICQPNSLFINQTTFFIFPLDNGLSNSKFEISNSFPTSSTMSL